MSVNFSTLYVTFNNFEERAEMPENCIHLEIQAQCVDQVERPSRIAAFIIRTGERVPVSSRYNSFRKRMVTSL